MIHVSRTRVKAPQVLVRVAAQKAYLEARKFFRVPEAKRRQERFAFDSALYNHHTVRDTLVNLFNGKCAYCESVVAGTIEMGVDHFRPMSGAIGLRHAYSPDHYWWLAYEWNNLYSTCSRCNAIKGAKFPTAGVRCPIEASPIQVAHEKRLLLDPCVDEPAKHLKFDMAGIVRSNTRQGKVTIDVLDLNRTDLVEERRTQAAALLEILDAIERIVEFKAISTVRLQPKTDLTAFLRRQARQVLQRTTTKREDAVLSALDSELSSRSAYLGMKRQIIFSRLLRSSNLSLTQSVSRVSRARPVSRGGLSEAVPTGVSQIVSHRIVSITMQNFKAIGRLRLKYPMIGENTPWLMLLGENATGKSSILQAVALTLAGNARRREMRIDASQFLRHGAKSGYVKLELSGFTKPITLQFRNNCRTFRGDPPEPNVPVIAYGATRLLPSVGARSPRTEDDVYIENLFNPFVPLIDVNKWLATLDRVSFDYTARAIKDILGLTRKARIVRRGRKGEILVRLFNEETALTHLSDGYQSAAGLAVDLIKRLQVHQKGGLESAEGIVLLDEMGAHLHPRWRMRIVSSLRQAFPRVQFLTSTHDPLCLRGLNDSEVTVLRRAPRGTIFSVSDLPPVKGLRVDQILTSEYFGLHSTLEPEIEAQFNEYYRLLALRNPSREQKRLIRRLESVLSPIDLHGITRRERMLLKVIDRYLAHAEQQSDPAVRAALTRKAESKLAKKISM